MSVAKGVRILGELKRCPEYCGVACIDGSCPIANREEYAER
jgi:hypothetical protein